MKRVARWILDHRMVVMLLYAVAVAVSIYADSLVKVNYELTDYLPDEAPSTVGLRLMEQEFESKPSNLRLLLKDVSIPEALEYKRQIAQVEGVKDVTWLDDSVDVTIPVEMMDQDTLNAWYKDGNALITAYVDSQYAKNALSEIRTIIGEDNAMAGDAVQSNETQIRSTQEIQKILLIAVPLIFVILIFSTTSFLEPLLFLITIGVAIIIGRGTNLIFGEISFITNACSAILQLAVSMDYAIFLVERFGEFRNQGMEIKDAMTEAMGKAFSSIISSSLTTIIGFLVLSLMKFKVGYDMGLVLAKGVLLSLVCVLTLLPVLTVSLCKLMDKTQHRPLLPSFKRFGRINARICIPVAMVVIGLVIMPSYLANERNDFTYGTTRMIVDPSLRVVQDQALIEDLYGKSNQMVLMVPSGQPAKEQKMVDELNAMDNISSISAYQSIADNTIPVDFVGRENLSALMSDEYTRMVITADTEPEGEEAFALVEELRALGERYYPGENYLTGGSSNIYDMRDTVIEDDKVVNSLSMIAIGLVLMLDFKSLAVPLILLLVIESSIWINLAVPYFSGTPLYYLASLIINTVQLGATVDYGILFTERYMEKRRLKPRMESAAEAISETFPAILTSASILCLGACMLGSSSSVDIVSQIGFLVGRGAAISAAMVVLVLPAILMILDFPIRLTTIGAKFYKKGAKDHENEEANTGHELHTGADAAGERPGRGGKE